MTQIYPYTCPVCGNTMATKAYCPCGKFERLLAAAKDATAFFIPVDEMYRRLRILTAIVTAIEKEAK